MEGGAAGVSKQESIRERSEKWVAFNLSYQRGKASVVVSSVHASSKWKIEKDRRLFHLSSSVGDVMLSIHFYYRYLCTTNALVQNQPNSVSLHQHVGWARETSCVNSERHAAFSGLAHARKHERTSNKPTSIFFWEFPSRRIQVPHN